MEVPLRKGFRLFAGPIDEPRARRAGDVLVVVSSVLGLAVLGWINTPPAAADQALIDLIDAFAGGWTMTPAFGVSRARNATSRLGKVRCMSKSRLSSW